MNIVVYCGSSTGANRRFTECACELGEWIARNGHALVYGGSSVGLMGTVSKAVMDAGGEVYGVEPRFFIEAGVAQHDLTRLYVAEDMSQRKAKMIELGDAFVAMPGGVGTLEEISEIFSRIRLGLGPAECFLLDIDEYYAPLKALLLRMEAQGFLSGKEIESIRFPASVEELGRMLEASAKHPRRSTATAPEMNPPESEDETGRGRRRPCHSTSGDSTL